MKRWLFYLITVALVASGNLLHASGTTEPVDTVIQFYEASKNGDTETIKQLIGGSFYNERRVLLEENSDYPNFLRDYYRGTELKIGDVVMEGDGTVAVIDMEIQFLDGGVRATKLLLKKDSGGVWKIVDEMYQ